jgi:hypothetical protein
MAFVLSMFSSPGVIVTTVLRRDFPTCGASFRRPAYTPRISTVTESRHMTTRRAACSCGQLHLTIEGEPSRISMCSTSAALGFW